MEFTPKKLATAKDSIYAEGERERVRDCKCRKASPDFVK